MTWPPELIESEKRVRAAIEQAERKINSLRTPEEREQSRQKFKRIPVKKVFASGHVLIFGLRDPLILHPLPVPGRFFVRDGETFREVDSDECKPSRKPVEWVKDD